MKCVKNSGCDELEAKTRLMYSKFTEEHGHKPVYASVLVKTKDGDMFNDIVKLIYYGDTETDPDDDKVWFYVDSLEELCGLIRYPVDFTIKNVNEFMDEL